MTRDRRADCCDYQEERRKLALRRSQRKVERITRDERKSRGRVDECDEDDGGEIEQRRRRENAESSLRSKLPKRVTVAEETMGRIKPSIADREKYSSERHARCLRDSAEIGMPSVARYAKPRKIGKTSEDNRQLKINSSENENEDERKGTANERKTRRRRVEKYSGVESGDRSTGESRRKKKSTPADESRREDELTESDCEDSICSFDSQINLSGLALTDEEIERIEKTRRSGFR